MPVFEPKIVDVQVNLATLAASSAVFNIPLILSGHNANGDLVGVYTSTDQMRAAGFSTNSPALKMASLLFSGQSRPQQIVVGKIAVTKYVVSFGAIAEDTVSSIYARSGATSKIFTYTANNTDTAVEVATALKAAIDADTLFSTKVTTAVVGSTLEITPIAAQYADFSYNENTTVTYTTTDTISDVVSNVSAVNNTYFWLMADDHTNATVLTLAAYAEENDKIFAFSSQAADVLNGTNNNILDQLNALGYKNTIMAKYAPDADKTFPEAGVVGAVASATPGTWTLQAKTIVGVPVNNLSGTQLQNIVGKFGNVYVTEQGLNTYRDGYTVSGNYLDEVVFALWMKSRTSRSILNLLKRKADLNSKLPHSDAGYSLVRQTIFNDPIIPAIQNGAILNEVVVAEDGSVIDLRPVVRIPSRANVPTADIISRILNGVEVEVVYATPVHYIKIVVGIVANR